MEQVQHLDSENQPSSMEGVVALSSEYDEKQYKLSQNVPSRSRKVIRSIV